MKKIITILLSLMMIVTMIPLSTGIAFADNEAAETQLTIAASQDELTDLEKMDEVQVKVLNDGDLSLSGYEVFRSVKKNKGYTLKPIFTTTNKAYNNTTVETGTRYYYKVRGFVTVNGTRYYTKWSSKANRKVTKNITATMKGISKYAKANKTITVTGKNLQAVLDGTVIKTSSKLVKSARTGKPAITVSWKVDTGKVELEDISEKKDTEATQTEATKSSSYDYSYTPSSSHTHTYAVQADGSWKCTSCGELLPKTDAPYIAFTSGEGVAPTYVYALNEAVSGLTVAGNAINYSDSTYNKTIYIRTSGEQTLNLDAPQASVAHYGSVYYVYINAVDRLHSYHENGTATDIVIRSGNLVIEEKGNVADIAVAKESTPSDVTITITSPTSVGVLAVYDNQQTDIKINGTTQTIEDVKDNTGSHNVVKTGVVVIDDSTLARIGTATYSDVKAAVTAASGIAGENSVRIVNSVTPTDADITVKSNEKLKVQVDITVNIQDGKNVTIASNGTLENNGKIVNEEKLENNGKIVNRGTIITNENSGGTVENKNDVENYGTISNEKGTKLEIKQDATVANYGTIEAKTGATLTNAGKVENEATLTNAGTMENTGSIVNNANLTVSTGATMTNSGIIANKEGATLDNDGNVENKSGAVINNEGTIDTTGGTVNNSGSVVKEENSTITGDITGSSTTDAKANPDVAVYSGTTELMNMTLADFRDSVNSGTTYKGYTVKLLKDVDLSDVDNWTGIGTSTSSFKGDFDGQNYAIKNLKIANTEEYQGFFRFVDGSTIKNIKFENAQLSVGKSAGILVGKLSGNSTIDNITTDNTSVLSSVEAKIGGLIGLISSGDNKVTIKNCVNNAAVTTTNDRAAGIVGGWSSTVDSKLFLENVTNNGNIKATYHVSAMLAQIYGGSPSSFDGTVKTKIVTFASCTNAGTLTGSTPGEYISMWQIGGTCVIDKKYSSDLFGDASNGHKFMIVASDGAKAVKTSGDKAFKNLSINDTTWNYGDLCSNTYINDAGWYVNTTGTNSVEFGQDALYPISSDSFEIINGVLRLKAGVMTSDPTGYYNTDVYIMETKGQAYKLTEREVSIKNTDGSGDTSYMTITQFRDSVNAGNSYAGKTATLLKDIDLNSVEWTPIGTNVHPFDGSFDGNSKTISNLKITKASSDGTGFFGYVNNAQAKVEFKNVTFKDSNVTLGASAGKNIGTFIGYVLETNKEIVIDNVDVIGTSTVTGKAHTGGIIGKIYGENATITNCENNASVTCAGSYAGGIIAIASDGEQTIDFNNCVNNGAVSGTHSGGIVGRTGSKLVNFSSCTNQADVTGTTIAGGIIGTGEGTIELNIDSKTNNVVGVITGGQKGILIGYSYVYNSTSQNITIVRATNTEYSDEDDIGLIGKSGVSTVKIVNAKLHNLYCTTTWKNVMKYDFDNCIVDKLNWNTTDGEYGTGSAAHAADGEYLYVCGNSNSTVASLNYTQTNTFYKNYYSFKDITIEITNANSAPLESVNWYE